jgi:transposase
MQTDNRQLNFNEHDIYVGIDVHKKSWMVSIMVDDIFHKRFSQDPNPLTLANYLTKNFPQGRYHSVYEAGFSGYWIHRELERLGINSYMVSPADVPTSDKERKQKDDKRDSGKLVKALRSRTMEPIYIPGEKTLQDRMLIRTREALVKDLTRSKNRVKSMLYFNGINIPECFDKRNGYWSNKFLKWVEQVVMSEESGTLALNAHLNQVKYNRTQVLELTRKIQQLAKEESYIHEVKLLKTVPGIGILTAMKILTEIDTINRFSGIDKLCAYIGLIPTTKSSGQKEIIGEITPRGHHILREAFIESAWTAIRIDPALLLKYKELRKKMETNQAIIRIAKKLVSRTAYVLRHNEPYEMSLIK